MKDYKYNIDLQRELELQTGGGEAPVPSSSLIQNEYIKNMSSVVLKIPSVRTFEEFDERMVHFFAIHN